MPRNQFTEPNDDLGVALCRSAFGSNVVRLLYSDEIPIGLRVVYDSLEFSNTFLLTNFQGSDLRKICTCAVLCDCQRFSRTRQRSGRN